MISNVSISLPMNSCATVYIPSANMFYSRDEKLSRLKEELLGLKEEVEFLKKVLDYSSLEDKYEVWKRYFVDGSEDGPVIDVEFPYFLDNYTHEVNKLIDDRVLKLEAKREAYDEML